MIINSQTAAEILGHHDDIVILAHHKPDGDTLGSCFALLFALEALGKRARVECADGYPGHFRLIYGDYAPESFPAGLVVACDVAEANMLGSLGAVHPRVDLCIDHHKSNTLYAAHTVLSPASPAAGQIVYRVITALGIRPDKRIATALYIAVATDTGCFRFANVTPDTLRLAAELIDCGANQRLINKQMFDNKSRGRIEVEKLMMQSLDYSHEGRCAMVALPMDILERFGLTEDQLDGISAFPRRIEGVLCGITIREKSSGCHRVSVRCEFPLDASAICARFGGGGHSGAAGCTITGSLSDVRARLRQTVGEFLERVEHDGRHSLH